MNVFLSKYKLEYEIHSKASKTDDMIVLRNGVISHNPLLPDHFHLGIGVFETLRITRKDTHSLIFALEDHIERIQNGAAHLGVSSTQDLFSEQIRHNIQMILQSSNSEDRTERVLRIIALQNEVLYVLDAWTPRFSLQRGASLFAISLERSFPEIKSCSALINHMAQKEATIQKADEALLVDHEGNVTEGAWSNFFMVNRRHEILTPHDKILPGITRSAILKIGANSFEVSQRSISLNEVLESVLEAFITNATHGIVWVNSINGIQLSHGRTTFEIEDQFQKFYSASCERF